MKALSLQRINAHSPYEVSCDNHWGVYKFVSDYGVSFGVSFDLDLTMTSGEAYQFSIINYESKPSPRDEKVRATVMSIVEEFFIQNNAALLYICETGDGKQKMRSRLFYYWFEAYKNHSDFLILPMTVEEEDGVQNFAALIIRRDNPNFNDVVTEFVSTINMLNDKPQQER